MSKSSGESRYTVSEFSGLFSVGGSRKHAIASAAMLAKATLETRIAEGRQAEARFQQATNDEERYSELRKLNKNFTSASEMDKYKFDSLSLRALVDVSKASVNQARASVTQTEALVKQAKAGLTLSKANLDYTKILSPVNGIVIERKIDAGQTMAAQFQTPELFVIGEDMREEMRVFAAVDEAGAPIVSICGGEPMIYPEMGRLVKEILSRKK